MDRTAQVGSQEINDIEFETFVEISKKVVLLAMQFDEPSTNVRWFKSYSESMQKTDFTPNNLRALYDYYPNIDSVNTDSIAFIHRNFDAVVTNWTFKSQKLRGLFEEFEKNGPPPIRFNYSYDRSDFDIKSALESYIEIGELMRADKVAFKKSNLSSFEDILLSRRPAIEKSLGYSCFAELKDEFRSGFIAIVAPSLEGKTQSAFAFRSVKPLYFVLPSSSFEGDDRVYQNIYLNYATLSQKLFDLSREDVAEIVKIKRNSDNFSDNSFLLKISAKKLGSDLRTKKFRVLGFLAALVEHARKHFTSSTPMTWMEFYTTAPRSLEFHPKSIEDMVSFDFSGFFVFLDEFVGLEENVFIRNVCRAAGIMVVVANTNTNIANLVGRSSSKHSRGPEVNAWCLVINHLNTLNENILKQMVPALESSIQRLKLKVKSSDLPVLESFFQDFFEFQLNHLRPGFARVVADNIVRFDGTNETNFSFLKFLEFLVHEFCRFLLSRKASVNAEFEAMMGTKALYLSNTYHSAIYEEMPMLLHRKSYLNYHYFYLINPVDTTKWCFLTFPPVPASKNADIEHPEAQSALRIMNRSDQPDGWKKEVTFFKASEFLAYLAFLSVWHDQSIESVFTHGLERHQASPDGTAEMPNTTQPVPFSGIYLEVLSLVCMINSSHRSFDSTITTFTGQSGRAFFSNLVKNLIVANGNRANSEISVSFHEDSEVSALMDLIHVPFLFPSNLPVPVFFQQFISAEGFNQRSIHVGEFERTRTTEEIDAKFRFFLKSESPNSIPSLEMCAVECKNWRQALSLGELIKIFGKAEAQNAKLSIVVCNQVCEYTEETSRLFISTCLAKRWNVLGIFKSSTGFEFDKIEPEIDAEDENYSMHCIVIELGVVNSTLHRYQMIQ